MALFKEKEVQSENQYANFDLKEMVIGESIAFYFASRRTATSEEYGDFTICQGAQVDLSVDSVDALIASATLTSWIPNTLLVNKLADGSLTEGEVYRIEKAWDKGQKFADNKKAKGWGYKLFTISVDASVRQALGAKVKALLAPLETDEAEAPAKAPAKPGV